MKKIYIAPMCITAEVNAETMIALSGEGGVQTGSSVGNEYNSDDESYAKGSKGNLWGEEW